MKTKYVALVKFQVYDRGDGPRWLEVDEPVPTHYMSPGLIASFVRRGLMKLVQELESEEEAQALADLLAIADVLDAQDAEEAVEEAQVEPEPDLEALVESPEEG